MPRKYLSDTIGVVATIDPDVHTAAAYTSDWAAAADFSGMLAIIMAGTLGASATLDAKLQQATDSSGTGAKDISGKAITQLTQAGTDSDKQALINFHESDLDTANAFTHVAIVMTVGTATSDAGALLIGYPSTYGPATNFDLASVDEVVQ
jgi:hypothetical protein